MFQKRAEQHGDRQTYSSVAVRRRRKNDNRDLRLLYRGRRFRAMRLSSKATRQVTSFLASESHGLPGWVRARLVEHAVLSYRPFPATIGRGDTTIASF